MPPPPTESLLANLSAEATEGPWRVAQNEVEEWIVGCPTIDCLAVFGAGDTSEADARLAVALVNTHRALAGGGGDGDAAGTGQGVTGAAPAASAKRLGTWVLTLASVEPGNSATFDLRDQGLGETEPSVRRDEATISFRYGDGKEVIYSWAHLLSAHYEPASEDDRGA